MEILRKTTVINLAFAFSIITFLTIKVKVIENPPVIEDIEQTILDLIDGISGAGDVAEDIKDDVICNVESDTKKGEDKTKGEGNADNEVPAGQAGLGQSKGGRHVPENLKEELGMEEVISNPENGMELEGKNTDKRWPADKGWEKWVQNVNGIEIHYEYNPLTGEVDDVKIK